MMEKIITEILILVLILSYGIIVYAANDILNEVNHDE